MEYSFDSERIKSKIIESGARNILLQLPDGLKPYYKEVVEELKGEEYDLIIWGGSNFGACDLPISTERIGVDLIIHFGHEVFRQ